MPTSVVNVSRTLDHLAHNGFRAVERDPAGWTVRARTAPARIRRGAVVNTARLEARAERLTWRASVLRPRSC
jgi:hypothetical protein